MCVEELTRTKCNVCSWFESWTRKEKKKFSSFSSVWNWSNLNNIYRNQYCINFPDLDKHIVII